jgi:hypothetical protein
MRGYLVDIVSSSYWSYVTGIAYWDLDNDPILTVSPEGIKAKVLLKSQTMTETNWAALETMVEKIMSDCMGGTLYAELVSLLKGKQLNIEINTGGDSSFFDPNTDRIVLNSLESNLLLHELFHVYQQYNGSSYYRMNNEIEARYAQYSFISKLSEYKQGSKWYAWYSVDPVGVEIANMKDCISKNGDILNEAKLKNALNGAKDALMNIDAYEDAAFNPNWSMANNFDSFKNLSSGC